ncbi:MAG: endolytic transglycosylase MltG [Candidatus Moranbacteria bacterium]|nr:endolytic transglycosylase MltG [Candidatus Moranbacteria bacterium]
MLDIKKIITISTLTIIFLVGCFFYIYNGIYFSNGNADVSKTISIESGDNALVVGKKLSQNGVISGKYYFIFYLWKVGKLHNIVAGVYEFPSGIKIPEIVRIVTGGQTVPMSVKVTFPEGWTIKDMAQRLSANGLDGEEFLKLTNSPTDSMKAQYSFLSDLPKSATLEGFLFPDTYYFAKEVTAEEIIKKMLDNFSFKVFNVVEGDFKNQNKSLFEIITMASIVEGEVKNDSDRKIVAGLFWNRIANGMPLQSDATLEYALGTNKVQHSIVETKIDSPYNTYQNKGLPPGPVSNPGLASILATLKPTQTDFVYFLSDPQTGKTIFSKTFQEHVANKAKYGL